MNATNKIKDKPKSKSHSEESVPSFIRKTYEILEEGKYSDVIRWSDDGTSIVITNPTEFSHKVLPAYFKHNNLTSFIRQLNMYDFHKKRTLNMDHVYCHDLFQRGKKHLLKDIRRKNSEAIPGPTSKSEATSDQGQSKQDLAAVVHENILLKKLNQEALARSNAMEAKMKDFSMENQALWTQVYQLREKESILKSFIINLAKQNSSILASLPPILQNELDFSGMNSKNDKDNSPAFTAQTTTKALFNPQNPNFSSGYPSISQDSAKNPSSQLLNQAERNFSLVNGTPFYLDGLNKGKQNFEDGGYNLLTFNPGLNQQLLDNWNANLDQLKPIMQNNELMNRGFNDDGNQAFSSLGKRRPENFADKDDLESYTKKLKQNASLYNDMNNKLMSQNMINLPNKENSSLIYNLMGNGIPLNLKEEGSRNKMM